MQTKAPKQKETAQTRDGKPTREEISEARRKAGLKSGRVRRKKAAAKEPLTYTRVFVSDREALNALCAREGLKSVHEAIRYLLFRYSQP